MGLIGQVLKRISGEKIGRLLEEWTHDAGSTILAAPAFISFQGKSYCVFGTKDGKLCVIDDKAKTQWQYNIMEKLTATEEMFLDPETMKSISASPIIADINSDKKPEIVVGSELGMLHALDIRGKLLWKYKTDGPIRSSPVFANKTIFVGSADQYFYALNPKGKLAWRFKAASGIEASCGLLNAKDKQIIFGSNDGTIYSLNGKGKQLWAYNTKGKITATPTIAKLTNQPNIIIGSFDNKLHVLDPKGSLQWAYPTEGSISSDAQVTDLNGDGQREVIFGACDDNLYVLSNTGSKIWSYETDFWIVAAPLVFDFDNDKKLEVVFGSYDNNLYVLDSEAVFSLDYMPGVSGVVQQAGSYSDLMTLEPGEYVGKKLWQYRLPGIITGITRADKSVLVASNSKLCKLSYTTD